MFVIGGKFEQKIRPGLTYQNRDVKNKGRYYKYKSKLSNCLPLSLNTLTDNLRSTILTVA